jgi:hypothetical protein
LSKDDVGTLTPNPLVVAQAMDEGLVLMDLPSGECFELNRVGAEVWDRLAKAQSIADIVTEMAAQYHAPASTVESDVRALVTDLLRRGLLTSARP